MRSIANRVPALAFALLSSLAFAQSNVGELLDAGAHSLSAAEFRDQIVQRTLVGLTAAGGNVEIVFATNGSIQGVSTPPQRLTVGGAINGEWTIDNADRICVVMTLGDSAAAPRNTLPPRCQYWFKLGEAFFIADSDTDRRAKVLRRTLKP